MLGFLMLFLVILLFYRIPAYTQWSDFVCNNFLFFLFRPFCSELPGLHWIELFLCQTMIIVVADSLWNISDSLANKHFLVYFIFGFIIVSESSTRIQINKNRNQRQYNKYAHSEHLSSISMDVSVVQRLFFFIILLFHAFFCFCFCFHSLYGMCWEKLRWIFI